MKKLSLFLATLLFGTSALAYPILYSCEEGSLNSQAKFDQNDLFEKFMGLEKSKQKAFARSVCEDSETCLKDFDMIIKAAGSSVELARSIFKEELSKAQRDFQRIDLPTEALSEFIQLRDDYSEIIACQNAKVLLGPEDFLTDNGTKVLTTYPFWNDYAFTSVCPQAIDSNKNKSDSFCGPIFKSELDRVIEESILMGVDPYLVISLSLMEGGSGNVGSLYLDPIGVMGAMGCSAKQVANNTTNAKAFESFGTSYIVNADIKKDPKLQKKLKSYFDHFAPEDSMEGQSYYCYNVLGKDLPNIFESPQPDSCCIDMGFKTGPDSSQKVSHALTYHFIDKITRNKFRGKEDPAWRAQRYNGFTNLMGAAEGVSNWRAGVNYYEDPAYGHQTMDYMLNSLMFNPYIRSKVKEFGRGKHWESLLCKDRPDGTYAVDSDRYFKKHKESQRLGVIEDKFKAGKSYAHLSSRERRVMNQELAATSRLNPQMPTFLSRDEAFELQKELWKFSTEGAGNKFDAEIFESELREKDDWKSVISGLHDFSEKELDIIYKHQTRKVELEDKQAEIDAGNEAVRSELNRFCKKEENKEECAKYQDLIISYTYAYENEVKLAVPLKFASLMNKAKAWGQKYKALLDEKKALYSSYDAFGSDSMAWETISALEQKTKKLEPLEKAIERYSKSKDFTAEIENKLKLYYDHLENFGKNYDKEKAFKEYFKSVYSKRKNIGLASDYPWRRLTEKEVAKAAKYFASRKEGRSQMSWPLAGMSAAEPSSSSSTAD